MTELQELQHVLSSFENLLAELDRLHFPLVAVHVDMAMRSFEQATGLASISSNIKLDQPH